MTSLTARSTPLYSLSEQYLAVLELLELDEINDDAGQLELALDSIAAKITDKAEGIAGLVKQFEMFANTRLEESKRMRALADADAKRAERLKAYLLKNLQAIGTEKVETPRFRISVRQNPPSVSVVDERQIPAEYLREVVTVSVDKRAILDTLKTTGEVVPGTDVTRTNRLEIR